MEQLGGVLAAPRKPRRLVITAVVLAVALAAAYVVVTVTRVITSNSAVLVATLAMPSGGQGQTSAAFSPGGRTLAVLDRKGSTHLWDVGTRKWTAVLTSPQCQGGDAQVLFSPDGKTLAVIGSNKGNTCLWNVAARQQTAVLTEPTDQANETGVTSAAFAPDGTMLAIGDSDGRIYLRDVATGRPVATLTDPAGDEYQSADVEAVAFSPDGRTLAAGDGDDVTYVWDVATRRIVASLNDSASDVPPGGYQDSGGIESVAFSPDGTLAVGDGDGNVYLWDAATGRPLSTLVPPINVLEANPLYNNPNADVAGQVVGGGGPIGVTVAYSKNGTVLAAGVDYGYGTDVWAGAAMLHAATLTDPGGDNSAAPQLALSPDGSLLAVADSNGRIYLWHTS